MLSRIVFLSCAAAATVRFTADVPAGGASAAASALVLLLLPPPADLRSGVPPARRLDRALAGVGGSGGEKEGKEVRKVGGGVDRVLGGGELPASWAEGERWAELRRAAARDGGASAGAWLSMLAFVARVRRVGLWVAGRGSWPVAAGI
jgi:hypothetical protein